MRINACRRLRTQLKFNGVDMDVSPVPFHNTSISLCVSARNVRGLSRPSAHSEVTPTLARCKATMWVTPRASDKAAATNRRT